MFIYNIYIQGIVYIIINYIIELYFYCPFVQHLIFILKKKS